MIDHDLSDPIVNLIHEAPLYEAERLEGVPTGKPEILVDPVNPDETVDALAAALRQTGQVFDRGAPCVVVRDNMQGCLVASPMTAANLVAFAHKHARPTKQVRQRESTVVVEARLPKDIASMYLESRAAWDLLPLNGFASTPLLADGGGIRTASGYDGSSGLWLVDVPDVAAIVPAKPTREEADQALFRLRTHFRTFCFADAKTTTPGSGEAGTVDLSLPPGADESAALCALMTSVARPSLATAPAILVRSAAISGAGTGKGLLCRAFSWIAFGRPISAVTIGETSQEFEKRLSAELMAGHPVVFLDNVNSRSIRSNLLATAITESPARVRKLGTSEMIAINSRGLILITGNGVSVSEDLVRRTILIELDAKTASPEARIFTDDLLSATVKQREQLLVAALTIWRWGRQNTLPRGCPAGGFETWSRWCRDPLLALGCRDPIQRQGAMKEVDPDREHLLGVFHAWYASHGQEPVTADGLHHVVKEALIPGKASRQALAAYLGQLAGVRIDEWHLQRLPKTTKWPGARYRLLSSASVGP